MLLTISTTHQPATDLGYLLHKNPSRLQTEELSFGKAYMFYPDASVELCTAALLVEIKIPTVQFRKQQKEIAAAELNTQALGRSELL
jgi:hypothetical protein